MQRCAQVTCRSGEGRRVGWANQVAQRGFARERVLDAALNLFAERGVNGTSLQMIADHLGVSKAAIYYQFHTKDDIVLSVVRPVFDDMDRLVRIAETISSPDSAATPPSAVSSRWRSGTGVSAHSSTATPRYSSWSGPTRSSKLAAIACESC